MKSLLLVLVCAFIGAPAMAEHQFEMDGDSKYVVNQAGQVELEISGPAAEMLWVHLSAAKQYEVKSDDGSKSIDYQRVGKNITCDKFVSKKKVTTTCTMSDIQKDGSSVGAAG